jgi:hypothetical protein
VRYSLRSVTKLLPPPDKPRGLDRSWKVAEKELGLKLPGDYKAFIDTYGSGQIRGSSGWVFVWNFRDSSLFGKLLRETLCGDGSIIRSYQRLEKESNYPCPYPTYPEQGGLLPFASVIDVQNLNWLTRGDPDRWDTVYWHFDGLEFTHLKGDSFGRCLLKMLRQEYVGLDKPSSLEPPYQFTDLPA